MNETELELCIRTHGKDIYSFLCQMTHSRQEAEDLYQDTFLKLMEIGKTPDFERNPKNYCLTIAVHLWQNRRRKYAWRKRITGGEVSADETAYEIPSGEKSVEQQMISEEEKRTVQKAVRNLPVRYQLPVVLFYMEERKLSEIAQILELPLGTVKSRLYKAKKKLAKELEVDLYGRENR